MTKYCPKKEFLLESAKKLFSKLGLNGTSTRDIAQESKVNISMISYHFGGKEGLYKSVIEDFAQKIFQRANEKVLKFNIENVTQESFVRDMKLVIEEMVDSHLDYPELNKLIAREKLDGLKISGPIYDQLFAPLLTMLYALISEAQKNKIVRKEIDPAVFFMLMHESIDGFYQAMDCDTAMVKMCHKYKNSKDLFKNQLFEIYVKGMLIKD